jgi:hypothetical protein
MIRSFSLRRRLATASRLASADPAAAFACAAAPLDDEERDELERDRDPVARERDADAPDRLDPPDDADDLRAREEAELERLEPDDFDAPLDERRPELLALLLRRPPDPDEPDPLLLA